MFFHEMWYWLYIQLHVVKIDVQEVSFDMSTADMSSRQTEVYDHKEKLQNSPFTFRFMLA